MSRPIEMRIQVDGLDEFIRAARKAGDRDILKAIQIAGKAGAAVVAVEAKVLAPKRTGKLAKNVRPLAAAKRAQVAAGGAKVPYAGPIHFGWQERNIEPQPFIYDALDARRDQVFKAYDKQIQKVADSFGR